jgi:acyl-CoA oxidase
MSISATTTANQASPFDHKSILFEPTIEHNGTAEQKTQWLKLAKSGKILDTYAQTELGHGPFVRGLETISTFDENTDEFAVYSPTIGSTKFWPAGLGFSITHAVIMAHLVVRQEQLGPHLFIVQLRSVEDGRPLPGIRIGRHWLEDGVSSPRNNLWMS